MYCYVFKEVKMNPFQLAGLVKRFYPSFDMTNFEDRLKLQKFVYLMQSSGLNLGYNFKLYLHGPYSTQLARDGFDMPKMEDCKLLKFENAELESKFVQLETFLGSDKDDSFKMEVIGSLHLFHQLYPEESDNEIIQMVEEKSPSFSGKTSEIKELLNKLKVFGGITW